MQGLDGPPPRSEDVVRAALGPTRRGYRRLLLFLLVPGWLAAGLVAASLRWGGTSHIGVLAPTALFAGLWTFVVGGAAWWLTRRSLGDLRALLREGEPGVARVIEVVGIGAPRLVLALADQGVGVVDIPRPAPPVGAEVPVLIGNIRPRRVVAITSGVATVGPRLPPT